MFQFSSSESDHVGEAAHRVPVRRRRRVVLRTLVPHLRRIPVTDQIRSHAPDVTFLRSNQGEGKEVEDDEQSQRFSVSWRALCFYSTFRAFFV
jgi:hypothetical protein